MTRRCPRCDPPQEHDDPHEHAEDAGHPLCARCETPLRYEEAGACHPCIDRLLENLTDLISAYEQLPDAAQQVGGSRHQHPGGAFLVMAGPGSEGRSWWTAARLRSGQWDDSHLADEHSTDPPSIAQELGSLENDWRRALGHPAAEPPAHAQLWDGFRWHPPLTIPPTPARPRRYLNGVVRNAVRYLQQHAEWVASTYPDGFVEAAELAWRLRQRLHGALGLLEPRETPAVCTGCAAAGVRVRLELVDGPGRDWRPPLLVPVGPVWGCARCGMRVSPEAYVVGLRASIEAQHVG